MHVNLSDIELATRKKNVQQGGMAHQQKISTHYRSLFMYLYILTLNQCAVAMQAHKFAKNQILYGHFLSQIIGNF